MMKIFDMWKKNEEKRILEDYYSTEGVENEKMTIKVFGSECCNSGHNLFEKVVDVIKAKHINAEIEYTTDVEIVMRYGIMSLPAIVINESVKSFGKDLSIEEITEILGKKM